MKKYILLLSMFLVTTIMLSQDFNKWAFDIEGGIHSVNDESSVSIDSKYYLGAGVRYSVNPTFGLGLRVGWNDLNLRSLEDQITNSRFTRVNLDAQVNLFRVLDLYSSWFTLYGHGGPGVAFLQGDTKETLFNIQTGVTGLIKVNKSIAVKADYTLASNVSQKTTLDGIYANNNYGITSTIHNASVGLVFYIGNKDKEHADWYEYPERVLDTIVNNYPTKIVKETVVVKESAICDCESNTQSEFVFFDHDKSIIKDTELNAIYKAYAQLVDNPEYKLIIKGYASPTKSSNAYNQKLSERRSKALELKYKLMGLDMSRVTIESFGKDTARTDDYVHDAARRVELIIIKK